jgi:hypothetical protein
MRESAEDLRNWRGLYEAALFETDTSKLLAGTVHALDPNRRLTQYIYKSWRFAMSLAERCLWRITGRHPREHGHVSISGWVPSPNSLCVRSWCG